MSWRQAYRDRRVLVLGAGGFIGQWTARALAAAGADLQLGVRAGAAPAGPALHPVALERPGAAAELLARVRPDVTFNLAGYGVYPEQSDPGLAERLNGALPGELAQAVARLPPPETGWTGQRLVQAGSAAEYGSAGGDLAESTPASPLSLYGRSKLAGSLAVLQQIGARGVRAVVARLFTVYGPGERGGRLLPTLLRAARHHEPIPLTHGAQQRDFTYVEDVAEGLLRLGCLSGARVGLVNLATGRLLSVRAFAERAATELGIAAERLQFGALPSRPDEMRHGPVAIARLRELTGWSPATPVEAGVRRTRDFREG